MARKTFEGLRVIDLTRYIAGPYCGQLLADMGAEVIKVEKPGVGEISRTVRPAKGDVSLAWPAYNRNKKSISLDTRKPEGMGILRELIAKSDVLLENFRAGTMEKMGLGWDEVRKINPRIIMVSVTGFGQQGPMRDHLAFDGVISTIVGATHIENGRAVRSNGLFQDHMAAMNATIAVMQALFDRQVTGEGQYIDVAMIASSALIHNDVIADAYANDGGSPNTVDSSPFGFLYVSDGAVYFHAGLGDLYNRLLTMVDDPYLHDPKFQDPQARIDSFQPIMEHLQQWAKDKKASELEAMFVAAEIPTGILGTPQSMVNHPHLRQAGYMVELPVYGLEGTVPYVGLPFRLSGHPEVEYRPAPYVGQHNEEIYRDVLGKSEEEMARLQESKLI